MSGEERAFLALLSSGLHQREAGGEAFSSDLDWAAVLAMAQRQTVLGVVAEAVGRLPSSLQPAPAVLSELHRFLVVNAKTHLRINAVTAEICERFRAEGVEAVLLKGTGLASNYPNPQARQCGDIDLYIPKKHQDRISDLANMWEGATDFHLSKNHLSFLYKGISVELHFATSRFYSKVDACYQAWTADQLENGAFRALAVGGATLRLAPALFDAIYVLHHLWKHLMSSGIGFRQVCDWSLFMRRYGASLDKEALRKALDDFAFWPVWNLFATLSVRHLGAEWAQFPLAQPVSDFKTNLLLRLILRDGNFGRRRFRPKNYIHAKVKMGFVCTKNLCKMVPLYPREVLGYMAQFLKMGILHFFLDWKQKR